MQLVGHNISKRVEGRHQGNDVGIVTPALNDFLINGVWLAKTRK